VLSGDLAAGGKELALELVELLLEQVALCARDAQFAGERLVVLQRLDQRLLQGGELFGRGHGGHRYAVSRGAVPGAMRICGNGGTARLSFSADVRVRAPRMPLHDTDLAPESRSS
jgi:hypothetical protein